MPGIPLQHAGQPNEAKHLQQWTKYLRQALAFTRNTSLRGNFSFYFSTVFVVLAKVLIWGEDLALAYNSIKF